MYYPRLLVTFIATFLFLFASTTAYAHDGDQDSNGGHLERSTGQYHCHGQDCVLPGSNTKLPIERLTTIVLAGILIWVLKVSIGFLVVRKRVQSGLVTEINANLSEMPEVKSFLVELEKQIKSSSVSTENVGEFTPDSLSFYSTQIEYLPRYFSSTMMQRLYKVYHAFWELEAVLIGFMKYLNRLIEKGKLFDPSEEEKITRTFNRAYSLLNFMDAIKIKKLKDLPI